VSRCTAGGGGVFFFCFFFIFFFCFFVSFSAVGSLEKSISLDMSPHVRPGPSEPVGLAESLGRRGSFSGSEDDVGDVA
jgi:hypothetical protein